jgi:acyl-CoA dehydrogenase
MFELPALGHLFTPEHEQFRATMREFVAREITPYVNEWDEAGTFPRSLYQRAAALGATGLGYPEEYGGTPADTFYKLVLAEEYARCGCGGVAASLNSHSIGLPPVLLAGSAE